MVEYLAQALRQTSREATILLHASSLDSHLQKLTSWPTDCGKRPGEG